MPPSPERARLLPLRIAQRLPYARRAVAWWRAWWDNWQREHEPVVKNIAKRNTLRAYNRIYRSDELLDQYLAPERLAFYREVANKCADLAPRRIIDVGCGTGHLLRVLVESLPVPPQHVVGVDRSTAGIRRARELLPNAQWIACDLHRIPRSGARYDLVLCTEVLEHVSMPRRAVEVLREVCAPGGRVALTVPDGAQDSWEGHVNFWTEDELREFLEPEGLIELERIQGGNVLLAWLGHRA
jgi:2-polyprenyl-3-methyl-5-hydroxy-6-metoxy-1,4-benzoquinol methylase